MINILISILVIQMIIFLHELGHYLAAKIVKADVYEFSVGFGPKLLQFKKNETTYTLNMIPLFGYVSFSDINEENTDENDLNKKNISENNLENKGYFQKLFVYLMGPLFNFLTAFIIFCFIFIPTGFPTTTIGNISQNTPSSNSILEIGDTVLSVNGTEIKEWGQISQNINESKGNEVSLKVRSKDGNLKDIKITPSYSKETDSYLIGISPLYKMDLIKSISYSTSLLWNTIKSNTKALFDAFFGWIPLFNDNTYSLNLSGPVGTIQSVSKEVKTSLTSLLLTLASISISLGLANLIPFIPILDGGQASILTVEAIRRKSFKDNTITNLKIGGALFMIGLMIIATLQDIGRLF